jgi:aryl-alcohol dehydrogenase-like predicted oxidoreductase
MQNHSKHQFSNAIQPFLLPIAGRTIRYGLGCAYLHRDYEDRAAVNESIHAIETAYASGFRYFDTAVAYGNSERIVGEFISTVPRDSVFLATKSSIPRHNASPQKVQDHVRKSLDESLVRMNTGHFDLFQLHDFETAENILVQDGVIDVLLEAKRQGVIRFFGAATRKHNLLEACARHGEFDTILTYSDFNLHNRSAAGLIDTAHALQIGVINASPLSGLWNYGFDLKDEAVLAAALQFPLTNPHIDITLTGPSNLSELQSSLRALSRPVDWAAWETHDKKV